MNLNLLNLIVNATLTARIAIYLSIYIYKRNLNLVMIDDVGDPHIFVRHVYIYIFIMFNVDIV